VISIPALVGSGALADRPVAPFAAPADRTLEEIVVTGTRLRIIGIESSAPVMVLSRRDIERGGADSVGKVLQTLPAITGSQLNTNVNAGGEMEPSVSGGGTGDGSVRASLRGGSLVLLNGRRFPNGGIGADTSVDLNTIPVSLIERVEVLTGGASAAYGSDAVGGVINIVTRRAGKGVELTGSRTITSRGDGEIFTAQAAIGLGPHRGAWGNGRD
jgi:iron complex outermembrane receptor protein